MLLFSFQETEVRGSVMTQYSQNLLYSFPSTFYFIAYTVITCSPLVPPTDGSIFPSSCISLSNYNQTCRLTCSRAGYSLIGTSLRTCGSDGQWTGSNGTRCTGELLNPLRRGAT